MRKITIFSTLLLLLTAVPSFAASCSAVAGNLVTNCGFEVGFTGWTVSGFATDNHNPHSGLQDAYTLCANTDNCLKEYAYQGGNYVQQALTTFPGRSKMRPFTR